jgi:hypothetical protein
MNRLIAELQRLYFLPGQRWHGQAADAGGSPVHFPAGAPAPAFDPVTAEGSVRALALGFERAADWDLAAGLHRGVQEDLDLPAPAISVSGQGGYQVWFSLAEPVPAEEALGFLTGLRLKFLADVPLAHLRLCPGGPGEHSLIDLVPARHGATGKWSAFIDPALGGMFADEPGLEMAPNLDRQADLLAGFESIEPGDFRRVLEMLRPAAGPAAASSGDAARPQSTLGIGGNFSDPKSFLLAVMNDPSATPGQRIKAAKALLPYFEKLPPE